MEKYLRKKKNIYEKRKQQNSLIPVFRKYDHGDFPYIYQFANFL